jgi:hypothetical protein
MALDYSPIFSTLQNAHVPELGGKDSPFGNYLKGMQMAEEPQKQMRARAAEERKAKAEEFAQMLKETYGKKEIESKLAHEAAHTKYLSEGHYGRGGSGVKEYAPSKVGKLILERDKYVREKGEDSPEVLAIDAQLKKESMGAGKGKVTGAFYNKQAQSEIANAQRNWFAKNAEMPYIGSGGNKQMAEDILRYKKELDPVKKAELRDKLAKAANAVKMAPEYASSQLNSQKIPVTEASMRHQLHAIKQGWPEGTDFLINNLPEEIQAEANLLHSKSLEDLTKISDEVTNRWLNGAEPESKKEEKIMDEMDNKLDKIAKSKKMTLDKLKDAIKHTANLKGIPEEEVIKQLESGG